MDWMSTKPFLQLTFSIGMFKAKAVNYSYQEFE